MQDVLVHYRMSACAETHAPNLRADHATKDLGAQVSAQRLRPGDPVVAAAALHRLVALIDEYHHGVLVVGLDHRAVGIVGIPRVLGDFADTDHVGAEIVQGGLDARRIGLRVVVARGHFARGLAVLQRDHAAEHGHHRVAERRLGDHAETVEFLLRFRAEVTHRRADEHVVALRHARNVRRIDDGRGCVDVVQGFHRVGAEVVRPAGVRLTGVAGARTAQAQPPLEIARLASASGCYGAFVTEMHRRADHHDPVARSDERIDRALFTFVQLTEACRGGELIQIEIARRRRMQA